MTYHHDILNKLTGIKVGCKCQRHRLNEHVFKIFANTFMRDCYHIFKISIKSSLIRLIQDGGINISFNLVHLSSHSDQRYVRAAARR